MALLVSPASGIPPLDPRPALEHAVRVADEACFVTGDESLRVSFFAQVTNTVLIHGQSLIGMQKEPLLLLFTLHLVRYLCHHYRKDF